MVKIISSNITEESGKPVKINSKKTKKIKSENFFENYQEEDDEPKISMLKTFVKLDSLFLSLSGIESIEKDIRFIEKPKAHWEYGITVNKNITPTAFIPKVDISVWYITPETRDEELEKLLDKLKKEGINFI